MIKHIAIIGLGSIGQRHLRLVRELRPEIRITIVRSSKGKKTDEEKYADDVCYYLEDAIESGIQAAIISNPAIYHVRETIKLMKASIHVLVEKPLSHTMENIYKLLEIEKISGVVGLIGYCLRYDPAAIKFREILHNEKTGQILHAKIDCSSYLPVWRPGKDYRQSVSARKELGGGVLLELSHEQDYIRWFFGNMESVHASLSNSGTLDIDVEDSADMIFKSKEGYAVTAHLDFNCRNFRRICSARCTEGELIWDAVMQEVTWRPADGSAEVERFEHERDFIYRAQLKHFFDCIEQNQTPVIALKEGVAVMRMIEAVKESNALGKTVALT